MPERGGREGFFLFRHPLGEARHAGGVSLECGGNRRLGFSFPGSGEAVAVASRRQQRKRKKTKPRGPPHCTAPKLSPRRGRRARTPPGHAALGAWGRRGGGVTRRRLGPVSASGSRRRPGSSRSREPGPRSWYPLLARGTWEPITG